MGGVDEHQIVDLPIATLVEAIQCGSIAAEDYARSCIGRHLRSQHLGALTHFDQQLVIEQARNLDLKRGSLLPLGPLAGIPFVVKDNIDACPFPTTAGTVTLARRHPARSSSVVDSLCRKDAILFGKANMHELAMGNTTSNIAYGSTRNPKAPDHVPGGSSGGSAAAVGAGIVPLALGTDTAASVRMPAACCGIARLRPTVTNRVLRRYPIDGMVVTCFDIDTIGPMARSVADLEYVDRVLHARRERPMPRAEDIRLGLPQSYFFDLGPGVEPVIAHQLQRMRAAGMTLVPVAVDGYAPAAARGFFTMLAGAVSRDCVEYHGADQWMALIQGVSSPDVARLLRDLIDHPPDEAEWLGARFDDRERLRGAYQALMARHSLDALAFPTLPVLPPPIDEEADRGGRLVMVGEEPSPLLTAMIRNTIVGSYLGVPGLSLPAGMFGGLPVGLELDGLSGEDEALLGIGRRIETIIDANADLAPAHRV